MVVRHGRHERAGVGHTLALKLSNITLLFPAPVPGLPPTAGFVGPLSADGQVKLAEEFPGPIRQVKITGTLKLKPVRFSGQLVSGQSTSVSIELREAVAYNVSRNGPEFAHSLTGSTTSTAPQSRCSPATRPFAEASPRSFPIRRKPPPPKHEFRLVKISPG